MKCRKCGSEFEPRPGLLNYCSMACRNSRARPNDVKEKIRNSVKAGLASGKIPTYSVWLSRMTDDERCLFELNKKNAHKNRKVTKRVRHEWECPVCKTILMLPRYISSKRKYCSTTCRNIALNPYQRGTRSKAELLAAERFSKEGFVFTVNDRTILPSGKELDFFFPDLMVGIGWNGIYHYKDINGKLEKIQSPTR